jgi:hypothetical protein
MKNMSAKFAIIAISALSLALTAAAETEFDNEFWISTSTNTSNLGTLDNPFDGSTATKFDTVMSNLPTNCTIHILAGTYMTDGGHGFILKSGQKVLGSGRDVTILRLIPTASNGDVVLNDSCFAGLGPINANIEISDLTCDCNYQGGTLTYYGVALGGTNDLVERVKVINVPCIPGSGYTDGFSIIIFGGYGNVVENCDVSQPAGGFVDGIAFDSTGVVRDNRIVLTQGSGFGISASGDGTLIQGNRVDDAPSGFYTDTGDITNVIIAENIFENVRSGVDFGGGGGYIRQNITINDNTIMLTTNNVGSGSGVYGISFSPYDTNVTIIGNTVGWHDIPAPSEIGFGYFLNVNQGEEGFVVANNRVDSSLWNGDYGTNGITPWNGYVAYNNYDFQGNLLTNLEQSVPFPGSFNILPPDAFIQVWSGPSITVGPQFQTLSAQGFYGWNCASNTSASMFKSLPLPNDYWGGRTTFVTSWNILTTNSGNYVFSILAGDVLTNDLSGAAQTTVTLAAGSGTNITTIAATNTLPTVNPAQIGALETLIYTGDQIQPGNYIILNGKVTAQ